MNKNIIENNPKNIIFFPKYAGKSPSYRVRFLAYKEYLTNKNFKIYVKELFDEDFYNRRIFQKKINYSKSLFFYIKRLFHILLLSKDSIAIIHIEILPYVPYLGEIILKIKKIPYIIDIDDAVYLRFYKKNFFLNYIFKLKFHYMIKNSSTVFAGNNFHISNFKNINKNIHYMPTVINVKKNNKYLDINKHKKFTIVWIGTPSTSIYLLDLIETFNYLTKYHELNLKLIGADKNILSNLKCSFVDWNEETELEELSKCHIGIMPLKNTHWELGKCSYKILQYMSLKLAVIASPIGTNKEIIQDNYNGLFAKNNNEWKLKILKLKDDIKLLNKLSKNGYDTILNNFNLEYFQKKYIDIIDNNIIDNHHDKE